MWEIVRGGEKDSLRRKGTRQFIENAEWKSPWDLLAYKRHFPRKDGTFSRLSVLSNRYCKPAVHWKTHYLSTPAASSSISTLFLHSQVYLYMLNFRC